MEINCSSILAKYGNGIYITTSLEIECLRSMIVINISALPVC